MKFLIANSYNRSKMRCTGKMAPPDENFVSAHSQHRQNFSSGPGTSNFWTVVEENSTLNYALVINNVRYNNAFLWGCKGHKKGTTKRIGRKGPVCRKEMHTSLTTSYCRKMGWKKGLKALLACVFNGTFLVVRFAIMIIINFQLPLFWP